MHDEDRDTATLSYATAGESRPRISRLAIVSLPAGIVCCPCLLSALVQAVMRNLPRALVDAGVFTWLLHYGALTLMLASTAVPIAAIVRIWASGGRRRGMELAATGLSLAVLWWLLLLLFKLTFRGWGAAAG
jgi:hypothetical protein